MSSDTYSPTTPARAVGSAGTPGPSRLLVRRDSGLWGYERALQRAGFDPVAGVDEAGRGACAGPLVVAAVILPSGRRGEVPGLADSKLLTPSARERVFAEVQDRAAATHVVVVPPQQIDRVGLHVCNVAGMRRALVGLPVRPRYVLTDGFPVRGLEAPGLAVWKGDRVAACIAAASVVAKVTRDRLMLGLHERFPSYGFDAHKGYVTDEHQAALAAVGPCPEHRFSYVNVRRCLARGSPAGPVHRQPVVEGPVRPGTGPSWRLSIPLPRVDDDAGGWPGSRDEPREDEPPVPDRDVAAPTVVGGVGEALENEVADWPFDVELIGGVRG